MSECCVRHAALLGEDPCHPRAGVQGCRGEAALLARPAPRAAARRSGRPSAFQRHRRRARRFGSGGAAPCLLPPDHRHRDLPTPVSPARIASVHPRRLPLSVPSASTAHLRPARRSRRRASAPHLSSHAAARRRAHLVALHGNALLHPSAHVRPWRSQTQLPRRRPRVRLALPCVACCVCAGCSWAGGMA